MFKYKQKRVHAEGDWGRCGICGTPRILIPWNTKVDILACDNVNCDKYRSPAGAIANHSGESSDG
ncbi:MAG TPA: hypothetical protein VMV84_04890 [Dehalococcoidales bacterium]|nr:hypothetical protein [Dehalococcoidales bacterium]